MAFLAAGVIAAVVRGLVVFAHGWWLVAYLVLVGALAQVLLGLGELWLAALTGTECPREATLRWQLVLWNAGTVAVAVADLARAPAAVLAGSVASLAAVALFGRAPASRAASARGRAAAQDAAYLLLVAALAASAMIGCYLAHALPGQ